MTGKRLSNRVRGALLAGAMLSPGLLRAHENRPAPEDRAVLLRRAEAAGHRALLLRKDEPTKGLASSRSLWLESARLFEAAHAQEQAASAYLEAAEIDVMLSRYGPARRSYRTALAIGTNEARCKALSGMARTYATTGLLAMADRLSNQAMILCEPLGGTAQAEGLEARGESLESAGEHAKSVEYFERAEALFAQAGDRSDRAQPLLMLAVALYFDGKHEKGLEAAGRALELWSSEENHYGVARARALLGIIAITRGEFETAQCNYRIARPFLEAIGNQGEEASVLNGLGYASRETGDWQKSLEYYQSAKKAFASVHDLLGEHEATTGMGKALLAMKRYRTLLALFQDELRLARQSGDPALIATSLADMAEVHEAEKRYETAETLYRRALETYRNAKHLYGEGDILIRLGRLEADRGKFAEALTLLDQAAVLKEKTGQVEEIAKVQYEKARIYRRLNRLAEARSAIERTIEIVEQQRVTIAQFDSRASYFASVHKYYMLYVGLLMQLSDLDSQGGFARKAFEASEKSKVRSLLDLLTTSAQDASCGELLEKQLQNADSPAPRSTATSTQGAPSLAGPTLTLDEVQAEINDGETILLEYALGEDKSYVWAVGREQLASYELPASDRIRKLVATLRSALTPPQLQKQESASEYQARVRRMERAYEATSKELSRLLLGPVPLPSAKRILVVPDGSLQYIPFAALPVPGSERKAQLMIDRYEIDTLPSASVLGPLRRTTAGKASAPGALVVFADPVFEQDDPRVAARPSPRERLAQERPHSLTRAIRDTSGSQYIPRLPASRDEAQAIAAIFSPARPAAVHVALDFDANRDYVVNGGLAQFRLIHFATHGVVDARRPEMSGLILSLIDTRGRKQDGYLRIGDIYKLALSADLVVLSSCESALGKDMESEGIIGLPRAFLYAGAKSVIASLWKVDDQASAKMMSGLYKRISRGEGPGTALRAAQLEMAHDQRWSKPYYWAAFAVQGDYR